MTKASALVDWTPERELDTYKTISPLCHEADYTKPPYAPKPWSGLIEMQKGGRA
jgi:hypothetical protein